MAETQTLFLILISFGIFAIILFILDIYFLRKEIKSKEKEEDKITLLFSKKFLLDLEKMIEEEIEKSISELNRQIIEELEKVFKNEISKFSQGTERKIVEFEEMAKREIFQLTNFSTKTQDLILKELKIKSEETAKDLKEKLNQTYKITFEDLNKRIFQIEKNIEEYKKERLKEVDRKIYQMIGEVAKKIIGKTIDLSVHEELVFQTLEKAKKEIL